MDDSLKKIYRSVHKDFAPQNRGVYELKLLLQTIYFNLDNVSGLSFDPFKKLDSEMGINRITIERNIYELGYLSNFKEISIKSKGLEQLIYHLEIWDVAAEALNNVNAPLGTEIQVAGGLTGQLLFILPFCQYTIVRIKKEKIKKRVIQEKTKTNRINYLNGELTYYKQNEDAIDSFQRKKIMEFLELELQKWNNFLESDNELFFHSNEDLLQYLNELIENELIHNIRLQEGYRYLWRDEKCDKEPRRETEIQPYIKTVLEPQCSKKNIKTHREPSSANGQIDFTFTYLNYSVCLEVKKAHHDKIEKAIVSQLRTYMDSERTKCGIYLILWFKSRNGYSSPTKFNNIEQLTATVKKNIPENYQILVKAIDCSRPISPSNQ